jgi:site-specific DNA recombinase
MKSRKLSKSETFVIDRIKAQILTQDNLQELVRLTNEEIKQSQETYQEHLAAIEGQLKGIQGRLHKLYDALETGKLELDDLAPRIKDLKGQLNELEEQRRDTLEHMREAKIDLLGKKKVGAYVNDLRTLLSKGALMEQKAFLRSFVKRIEIDHPRVVIDYTIPLNAQKAEPLTREVLPLVPFSSPGRTRTSDQLVNSQPLYLLSYRGIHSIGNRD